MVNSVGGLFIDLELRGAQRTEAQLTRLENTVTRLNSRKITLTTNTNRASESVRRAGTSARGATSSVDAYSRSVTRADRESIRFNQTTKDTASNLRDIAVFSTVLGLGGLGALSAILSGASRANLEFGRTVAEVGTLILEQGQTLRENGGLLDRVEQSARRLASTFGGTALQQIQAFYQGFSATDAPVASVERLITSANRLAVAGGADLESTTTLLAGTLNAYSESGLTATYVSDILFNTVDRGITTIPILNRTLAQVSTTAAGLGIQLDVVGAGIAALSGQGIRPGEVTTQLASLFTSLERFTPERIAFAESLGITSTSPRDFVQFLRELVDVLGQYSSEADKAIIRQRLFGNEINARRAINALSGGGAQTFFDTLDVSRSEELAGTAERAFNIVNESDAQSVSRSLGALTTSFEDLGEAVNIFFVPAFEAVAGYIEALTRNLPLVIGLLGLAGGGIVSRIAGFGRGGVNRALAGTRGDGIRDNFRAIAGGQFRRRERREGSRLDLFSSFDNVGLESDISSTATNLTLLTGGITATAIAADVATDSFSFWNFVLTALPILSIATTITSLTGGFLQNNAAVQALNVSLTSSLGAFGRFTSVFRGGAISLILGVVAGLAGAFLLLRDNTELLATASAVFPYAAGIAGFGGLLFAVNRYGSSLLDAGQNLAFFISRQLQVIADAPAFITRARLARVATVAWGAASLITAGSIRVLGTAIRFAFGPIGIALFAITSLVAIFRQFHPEVSRVAGRVYQDLIPAFQTATSTHESFLESLAIFTDTQSRLTINEILATAEAYAVASAEALELAESNYILALSQAEVLRNERNSPYAFGQGQQGDLNAGQQIFQDRINSLTASIISLRVQSREANVEVDRIRGEFSDLLEPLNDDGGSFDEAGKNVVTLADLFDNVLIESIMTFSDLWSDIFDDAFDSVRDFSDAVTESFRSLVAQLISTAVSNQILLSIGFNEIGTGGQVQRTQDNTGLATSLAGSVVGGAAGNAVGAGIFGAGGVLAGGFLSQVVAALAPLAVLTVGLGIGTALLGQRRTVGSGINVGIAGGESNSEAFRRTRTSGLRGILEGRNGIQPEDLDAQFNVAVQNSVDDILNNISRLTENLGVDFNASSAFSGTINTFDRTAEQIEEDLQNVLAGYSNTLAGSVSGLQAFALVGESTTDTLERLSNNLSVANDSLNEFGFTTFHVGLQSADSVGRILEAVGGEGNFTSGVSGIFGLRDETSRIRILRDRIQAGLGFIPASGEIFAEEFDAAVERVNNAQTDEARTRAELDVANFVDFQDEFGQLRSLQDSRNNIQVEASNFRNESEFRFAESVRRNQELDINQEQLNFLMRIEAALKKGGDLFAVLNAQKNEMVAVNTFATAP